MAYEHLVWGTFDAWTFPVAHSLEVQQFIMLELNGTNKGASEETNICYQEPRRGERETEEDR